MSVVWQGYDEVLNRPVAVKLLRTSMLMKRRAHERVRTEARAAAQLAHPNVASVYDFGRSRLASRWVSYLVMELLDGETLAERLRGGPLDWPLAARICAEVAAGLSASHTRGVVHRDVKPANVVLTTTGAKVVDFGIAAAIGQRDPKGGGKVLGTPAYVAPERLRGEAAVPGTDVYAVGLLLYHCLTGRLPWIAATAADLINAHLEVEPEPLPQLRGIPSALAELCQRCLSKRPSDRPSAREVALVLSDCAGTAVNLAAPIPQRAALVQNWWEPPAEEPVPGKPRPSRPPSRPGRPRRAVRAGTLVSLVAAGVLTTTAASVPEPWQDPPGVAATPGPESAPAEAPRHQGTVVDSAPGCQVGYTIDSGQGDRTTASVTVSGRPSAVARDWALTFVLPPGRYLAGVRGANWTQSGRGVTLRGDYPIPAGHDLVITVEAAGNVAGDPDRFALNGVSCGLSAPRPAGAAAIDPPAFGSDWNAPSTTDPGPGVVRDPDARCESRNLAAGCRSRDARPDHVRPDAIIGPWRPPPLPPRPRRRAGHAMPRLGRSVS
jgi:serine/threonine-protein kinase